MEVAKEVEDDVFFADLIKQISLLIMDDDEESVAHCPSASFQASSRGMHPSTQSSFIYEQTCRRESKGTGVFIPLSSHPRRKSSSRQGRFNSLSNKKFQRHSSADHSRGLPHNNTTPTSESFNPKRC